MAQKLNLKEVVSIEEIAKFMNEMNELKQEMARKGTV
jgi:hypothetical protein